MKKGGWQIRVLFRVDLPLRLGEQDQSCNLGSFPAILTHEGLLVS
jgi:hypothetical protein